MGDCPTFSVPGHHRRARIRGRGLWLVVLTILAVMALPAAAAQADSTWSGLSTTSPNWSDTNNWVGNIAPVPASALNLIFPTLTCAASATCYTTANNLSGVIATGLTFSNTAGQYVIHGTGNPLTIGAMGINASSGNPLINEPLVLNASQIWSVGTAGASTTLSIAPPATSVTGTSIPLGLSLPNPGSGLFMVANMEVGPVTVTGTGGLHIGNQTNAGSVNGTNGQPVTINGGLLVANPSSRVGALTMNGGQLLLGTTPTNNVPTTLDVAGGATLNSASTFTAYINSNGPTRGTNFSQLSATGTVALAGPLSLGQGPSGACAALTSGDVATLVTAGSVQGTFSNAAQDAVIPVTRSCTGGMPAQVRIHYTANSVTATVVTITSTTLAAPNPSPASTNQAVTLAATVTSTVTPSGTVAFSNNGTPIPGCTAQPVSGSGTTGTATCTTLFAAASSPESLTAAFTGTTASGQGSSVSSPQALTVNKTSTATALAVSNKSPGVGGSVTYTATVTPGVGGPYLPSGAIQFRDGGTPVAGCGGRPLTVGSSSSTASCTVAYPSAGSHSIIAGYGGDASFGPSSSPATLVTVGTPPPPPPAVTATSSRASRVSTTGATLNGSVTTGGASVSWKFEYGRSTRYGQTTPVQTIAAGQGTVSVSSALKRLSPNVRYHYRLLVNAAGQTVDGRDVTFTTKNTGRLLFSARRLSVIGRTILVAEKCQSKVLCTGRFSITTKVRVGKKKKLATLVCATGSFRIRAHRTATARARLSTSCLRLLKAQRHRRLSVTYTSQTRSGQQGLSKRITLMLR